MRATNAIRWPPVRHFILQGQLGQHVSVARDSLEMVLIVQVNLNRLHSGHMFI